MTTSATDPSATTDGDRHRRRRAPATAPCDGPPSGRRRPTPALGQPRRQGQPRRRWDGRTRADPRPTTPRSPSRSSTSTCPRASARRLSPSPSSCRTRTATTLSFVDASLQTPPTETSTIGRVTVPARGTAAAAGRGGAGLRLQPRLGRARPRHLPRHGRRPHGARHLPDPHGQRPTGRQRRDPIHPVRQAITVDLLANDTDPDGDPLTLFSYDQEPADGTITRPVGLARLFADASDEGVVIYRPDRGWEARHGSYFVTDGAHPSTATLTVTTEAAPRSTGPRSSTTTTSPRPPARHRRSPSTSSSRRHHRPRRRPAHPRLRRRRAHGKADRRRRRGSPTPRTTAGPAPTPSPTPSPTAPTTTPPAPSASPPTPLRPPNQPPVTQTTTPPRPPSAGQRGHRRRARPQRHRPRRRPPHPRLGSHTGACARHGRGLPGSHGSSRRTAAATSCTRPTAAGPGADTHHVRRLRRPRPRGHRHPQGHHTGPAGQPCPAAGRRDRSPRSDSRSPST